MNTLIHYFSSFDKLMKEKLVAPLFWLLVVYVGANFLSEFFGMIGLDLLDGIIDFLNLFVGFLAAFVGLRVLCELAVAIFRINDNLSPDKGRSELADIDPVAEARRAAEDAARRARLATDQAVERTQNVASRAAASTRAAVTGAAAKTADAVEDFGDRVEEGTDALKARMSGDNSGMDAKMERAAELEMDSVSVTDATDIDATDIEVVKKADTPKADTPTAGDAENGELPPVAILRPAGKPANDAAKVDAPKKRGRPKGSKNAPPKFDPVTGERLKKDGTPYKKPGPKPSGAKPSGAKSKPAASGAPKKRGRPKGSKNAPAKIDPVTGQRLKKDGTPAKRPGPKPKAD